MSGRKSRRKGSGYERKVRNDLREIFADFAESIQRDWQQRSGAEMADVEGMPLRVYAAVPWPARSTFARF